jgi:hypothetical protein
MAELKLVIPDRILDSLLHKLGPEVPACDIPTEALTLFDWAVTQRAQGRVIFSADSTGAHLKRLSMPALELASTRNHGI